MPKFHINTFYGQKVYPSVSYPGTTETVPNQAPSLQQLIQAAVQGLPLPQTAPLRYDSSEVEGEARVSAWNTDIAETVIDARDGLFDNNQNEKDKPKETPTEVEVALANDSEIGDSEG